MTISSAILGPPALSQGFALAAAEPRDREYDDQQGDGDDADPNRSPQCGGQHRDAEVCRFGLTTRRIGADRRLIIAGDGAWGRGQGDLDRLRLAGREIGQLLWIEAGFPTLRGGRAEFDVARRLAAVIAHHYGKLAVLSGIGLAAEAPAFTRQRQPRLAEYGDAEVEIGRGRLALGMHRELVVAGRRVARQRHRGLDVL